MDTTPRRFGPPTDTTWDELPRAITPVGEPCQHCQEPVAPHDSGVISVLLTATGPKLVPMHIECEMRKLVGGVNHQLKRCICCGGTEPPDPPGISRRHAARLAYKLSPPFAELTQMS